MALSLMTKQPFLALWKENFLWTFLTTLAAAWAAALIFLHFEGAEFLSLPISTPIVTVHCSGFWRW